MSVVTSDAGTCLMIRGETEEIVEQALRERERQGYKRQGPPVQIGKGWIATCAKPGPASATSENCRSERIGLNVVISGPSESAVREAVSNLTTGGAKLIAPIHQEGNEWRAICEAPR